MKAFSTLRRSVPLGVFGGLLLLVLACGGGSDDESGAGSTAVTNNPTSTAGSSNSSSTITSIDRDTAVVTVGSERFEFDMTSTFGDTCLTLFNVVGGAGGVKDGSDIQLDITIPPAGYEDDERYEGLTTEVRVRDDVNNRDWQAGGEFLGLANPPSESESGVVSYETDGTSAKGTARFIDVQALRTSSFDASVPKPEPVDGTFEISCN